MSKTSWGTKRSCPACSVNFYDLKKHPATCPKCGNEFDPEIALKKRKINKKELLKDEVIIKKNPKNRAELEDDLGGDVISDIIEIDDADEIESLQEFSELEQIEEEQINDEDDADDEALIEELDTGGNNLVGDIEEEEAMSLEDDVDEDSSYSASKKRK